MSWWGKLLGGTFGYMLGGPLGALIGAAIGHNFDRGLKRLGAETGFADQERIQTAFFTATFSVMGHIAKADGRVSEDEIQLANRMMDQMSLSPELKRVASGLFDEGKSADFPLHEVLDQFRRECHHGRNLPRIFMEIQLRAAFADGAIDPAERAILELICERLRLSPSELNHLEAMLRAEGGGQPGFASAQAMSVADAYSVLDVDKDASDAVVKKAYRRLMSQHHPDKLVAKGLPEEMMKVATEKTQEIKAAYDRVVETRQRRQ